MKKRNILLIYTFIYLFKLTLSTNANEIESGFDIPLHIEKLNMGKSEYTDNDIIKTCYIYSNFIVTELNDPGLKGAVKIGIDKITNKERNYLDDCKKNFNDYQYKIIPEGYFKGKINNYVFTRGSDSHGSEIAFQIFELSNNYNRLLFEGIQGIDLPFLVSIKGKDILSLKYWSVLQNKSNCSIFNKTKSIACWKKRLKENNIKNKLNLQECINSVKKNNPGIKESDLKNSDIQTLIYIGIPNINYPRNIKLLSNTVKCYLAP